MHGARDVVVCPPRTRSDGEISRPSKRPDKIPTARVRDTSCYRRKSAAVSVELPQPHASCAAGRQMSHPRSFRHVAWRNAVQPTVIHPS
jgi:hypothetical protein